jgi:hypothetical protein
VRHALALQVAQLLIRAVALHHRDQVIALPFFLRAFDCKRHRAGEIHRKTRRTCRESTDMQTSRAHRFDLGGIRLNRKVDDALARALA